MGKKAKLGKRRKDKFYQLAKETGYRARSAFKLIQLNRKFQFLQQSRVLVDLCAAPGGWLQVASQHMPVSSIIIGVDLVSIKAIPNVITIQADITTPNCRQLIQKELQTWKVDCVLNDGAPNVGTAWIQDAFTQAQLTLSALKLATDVLKQGGWFITKIFRSKDYQALLNVLQQLFKKVHATKPQASRSESAEIFVVCQGYAIKGKPDPKLLDPKIVFEEQEPLEKPKMSLQRLQKPSKAAEGYREGQHILFESLPVIDFIMSDDHMSLLATVHQLVFDKPSEVFKKHPLTTDEIQLSCQDIKVLGLRELKKLVKWREKMKEFLDQVSDSENEKDNLEREEVSDNEMDLTEVDSKIKELAQEEKAELKRILRHKKKQKKKLQERLTAQLEAQTESAELTATRDKLFSLKAIKTGDQLEKVDKGDSEQDGSDSESETAPVLIEEDYNQRNDLTDEEKEEEEEEGSLILNNEEEGESEYGDDDDEKDIELEEVSQENSRNPLLVSLEEKKSQRKTNQWFSNPVFDGMEEEEEKDEEEEIASAMRQFQLRGGTILSKSNNHIDSSDCKQELLNEDSPQEKEQPIIMNPGITTDSSDSSDDEDDNNKPTKIRKLDPAGLAIGALMVQSRKKRQELIESGYNRWTADDSNLPDWFREDENSYCQKQLSITKDMVNEYRKKLKEINDRPIKKIAEAKARKKARATRKLNKAREKAQVICETNDVTDQEKVQKIKSIYRKAGLVGQKKEEVKYIVAKKGLGKRVRRPPGVSGRFKVVDPRMKKDNRKQKIKGAGKRQKKGGRKR